MNGALVESRTELKFLFSIQIQMTWSYWPGGWPCPHGSDHDAGVVGVAEVTTTAGGTSVVVTMEGEADAGSGASDTDALVVDEDPSPALHADSDNTTIATKDVRLTSHSLARPLAAMPSRLESVECLASDRCRFATAHQPGDDRGQDGQTENDHEQVDDRDRRQSAEVLLVAGDQSDVGAKEAQERAQPGKRTAQRRTAHPERAERREVGTLPFDPCTVGGLTSLNPCEASAAWPFLPNRYDTKATAAARSGAWLRTVTV